MKNKNLILLLAILALALVLRIVFFTGATTSDELAYYQYSYNALHNKYQLVQDHFSSRIGLTYGQAFLYRLFGISEFTSNLFTLIASLSGIVLIYYFGKLMFNEKVGLLSAFLLSFYPLDAIYATRLLPDLPAALFMALTVYFFLKSEKAKKTKLLLFLSGVSFGIAYLIKELAIILGIFFIFYLLHKKKIDSKYAFVILGFLPFVFIEFAHAYHHTGNAFFRHAAIESQEVYFMKTAYPSYFTFSGLLSRLFLHYPYIMLTDVHYGLFFVFVFASLFYFIKKRSEGTTTMLLWFSAIMLFLNFGTVSLRQYVPIGVMDRFLVMVTFPSILLLSNFVLQKEFRKNMFASFIVIFLLITSIGFVYISKDRSKIDDIKSAHVYLSSLAENGSKIVYTDERTAKVLRYISNFENMYEIKEFNKYDSLNFEPDKDKNIIVADLKKVRNSYILVNWPMISGLNDVYPDMKFPDEVYKPLRSWEIKKEFGKGKDKAIIYYT